MLRQLKDICFHIAVKSNPLIDHEYAAYKEVFPERYLGSPVSRWRLLLRLNIHYRVLRRKPFFTDGVEGDKIEQALACEKIRRKIGAEYDDVYLCKHHLGEIYIYLNLIYYFAAQNGSKKPIMVVNQARYRPLYEMLPVGIDWVYVPVSDTALDMAFPEPEAAFHGQRFFSPVPDRFERLRNEIAYSDGAVHFYDYICRSLRLDPSVCISFKKPCISEAARERTIKKAEKICLDLNHFVVILPEATTASELSLDFWESLCGAFRAMGYDVFINAVTQKYARLNAKQCPLNVDEIYCLSEMARGVIALVNGLVVTFAQMDVPRHVIYTDQNATTGVPMTSTRMLKSYSMAKLPGCRTENLQEIDFAGMTEYELSALILGNYK